VDRPKRCREAALRATIAQAKKEKEIKSKVKNM
jgi:hypothetical protein